MPRSAMPEGRTAVVYRYAVRGDLPQPVLEEIFRGHQLRNKLTEIELSYQEDVAAAWAEHPDVAAALERLAAAEDLVAKLAAKVKGARRTAQPDAAALAKARAARRAARQEVRALKDRHYAGAAKPAILEAGQARTAALKGTYPEAIADGLYWATYNDIREHHQAAVAGVKRTRAAGRAATLRYRRWRGEGTIAVHLRRRAGDPAREPAMIASSHGKWRNVAVLSPWDDPRAFAVLPRAERRKAARRGTLTFRVGSGEHATQVTVPVVLHRMIPADADITRIHVTRRVIAGKPEASIAVTCRRPQVPARTDGHLVAVHTGWRALPDGALRVAVVAGAGAPPAGLTEPGLHEVVRDHAAWAEIVVPARWRDIQASTEKIRSRRDVSLEEIRVWLVGQLADMAAARSDADPDGTMARWRSPARFAVLAIRWRDAAPEGCEAVAARLEAWRRQDHHLWQAETHGRDQLARMREECWRRVAAWITASAAAVAIDEWAIAPLARRSAHGAEEAPQACAARANRVLAAPGRLRDLVSHAARARGVTIVPAAVRAVHHQCGRPLEAAQRAAQVMVWCPRCEVMVDQDWTMLQVILAAALAAA